MTKNKQTYNEEHTSASTAVCLVHSEQGVMHKLGKQLAHIILCVFPIVCLLTLLQSLPL